MDRDVPQACTAPVQVALFVLLVPHVLRTLLHQVPVQQDSMLFQGTLHVLHVQLDIPVLLHLLRLLYVQQTLYVLQAQLLNNNVLPVNTVIKEQQLIAHLEPSQLLELEFVVTVLQEHHALEEFRQLVLQEHTL